MDEIKPAPDQNDGVGLGGAILTTFVYNAPSHSRRWPAIFPAAMLRPSPRSAE
jgi:hypothetical protein